MRGHRIAIHLKSDDQVFRIVIDTGSDCVCADHPVRSHPVAVTPLPYSFNSKNRASRVLHRVQPLTQILDTQRRNSRTAFQFIGWSGPFRGQKKIKKSIA